VKRRRPVLAVGFAKADRNIVDLHIGVFRVVILGAQALPSVGFAVPASGSISCARNFDAFSPRTVLLHASVAQDVSRNR